LNYDDDLVLFGARYAYDLTTFEKFEFDKINAEIEKEGISDMEKLKKASEALEKFIIDNKIANTFTKEQTPKLRKIASLTLNEAKDYFDKNFSDEEKDALLMEIEEEMRNAKKYTKEDKMPTKDDLFIGMIKENQLSKLKDELALSNISKAQEEALLGMKVADKDKEPVNIDSDDGKSESDEGEDVASPSHSAMSAKTTAPYGTETASSVGEITSVEEAKRRPGRPAKRPETIARQKYEDAVKNYHLTKMKNKGKTFEFDNFNQGKMMDYRIDLYKSFHNIV
jgi:hypothetical protein